VSGRLPKLELDWRFTREVETTEIRKEVHEEIDRMTDKEVRGVKEYMATYPDPVAALFRNAPFDDEPYTEEEQRLVAEARDWLKHNGGKGIPHEEVMRELGLE
jgi:hypothetical protein